MSRTRALAAGVSGPVLVAVLVVVLRLPYLSTPIGADEAGFLIVARHWDDAGGSLYGPYWVDRPPLLIAFFRVADAAGGLPALRVLGCVAAVAVVMFASQAVRRICGGRAAFVAAVVAGGLLVSPQLGTLAVNGELLAAPFVAGGVWAAVVAVTTSRGGVRWVAAVLVGVSAAGAVLVKQNMVDVGVFALVLLVVALRRGVVRPRGAAVLVGGATAGLLVVTLAALVLVPAGPGALLYAMYGFRVDAVAVLAADEQISVVAGLARLLLLQTATLGPLIVLALVGLSARGRLEAAGPAVVPTVAATLALTAWAAASIAAGGSYWTHYLVQLIVPTALAAGLLGPQLSRLRLSAPRVRVLLSGSLVAAAVAWTVGLTTSTVAVGEVVGGAVGDVAEPDDTIVSLFGASDVVESSGLSSPYPYLWALPAHTLDPRLADLRHLLERDPPVWLVVRDAATLARLDETGLDAVVEDRYRVVGSVCGRTIYLRDGVARRAPVDVVPDCRVPLADWA